MKKIFTFILLLYYVASFAQTGLRDAEVLGNIAIGNKEVTAILDETTGCIHKSSVHEKGMFIQNERVQLKFEENTTRGEVIKPYMAERVFVNNGCDEESNLANNIAELKNPNNRAIIAQLQGFQVKSVGEYLEFPCLEELKEFIKALEVAQEKWIPERTETANDYVIYNEPLDFIESSLDFRSFRKMVEENEIEILSNSAGMELEDLADPNPSLALREATVMALFNDQMEVKIGTSIFKYVDNEHVAEIKDGSRETLKQIRNGQDHRNFKNVESHYFPIAKPLPRGPKIKRGICGNGICEKWACESESSCSDCFTGKTGGSSGSSGTNGNSGSSGTAAACVTTIIPIETEQDVCDIGNPNGFDYDFLYTITNNKDFDDDGFYSDQYVVDIDYGDGNSDLGLALWVTPRTHTYASPGTYTVSLWIYNLTRPTECSVTYYEHDITVEDVTVPCFKDNGSMSWKTKSISSNKKFKYQVKQYSNWLSSRLVAETKYYKRKKSSKPWRNKRVGRNNYIHASLYGDYYEEECTERHTASASKTKKNRDSAKAKEKDPSKDFGTRSGDVVSTHYVKLDGVKYSATYALELDPCP